MNLAIERGELELNPCKQVRRNKERPRKNAPSHAALSAFLKWAWADTAGQSPVLAGMAEFASIIGNRGVEFRELSWPQVSADAIRIRRAKQHDGKVVMEVITIDPMLADLIARLRLLAKDDRHGLVFPNSQGNAYTAQSFKLAFNRLKKMAKAKADINVEFTFHDLRSYFVTAFKAKTGSLPELHADPATTARIYDASVEVKRSSL
jgi:integrase